MRWPANTAPPRRYSWHRWLAWYPIRFGDNHVWLEIVQRRYVQRSNSCGRWEVAEYREDLPESRINEETKAKFEASIPHGGTARAYREK